ELTSMTHVFVVEDGFVPGGVGSHLSYQLNQSQLVDPTEVVQLGVPIGFIKQGKPNDILARLGLDGIGIAKSVMAHLNHNQIA
ncbi:protein containing Transketolase, partial [mine drainage metagenome]